MSASQQKLSTKRFSKANRMLRSAEFQQAFSHQTHALGNQHFRLVVANNTDQIQPRLGLAISKKVAARAVDRNRIKRVVREAFRLTGTLRSMQQGLDIIVLSRLAATQACNMELRASIRQLFNELFDKICSDQQARQQHQSQKPKQVSEGS